MHIHNTEAEKRAEMGENIHSRRQFFAAELTRLWPVWLLGIVCIAVIVWLRFHGHA